MAAQKSRQCRAVGLAGKPKQVFCTGTVGRHDGPSSLLEKSLVVAMPGSTTLSALYGGPQSSSRKKPRPRCDLFPLVRGIGIREFTGEQARLNSLAHRPIEIFSNQ